MAATGPGLLRDELGYDGFVLSDWELINDNLVGDQVLPTRAWGVEHLDAHGRMELLLEAGFDQFGGEECVEILADLVAAGRVTEARVDVSARRALLVKFRLGLFDDPYVDEDEAGRVVGSEELRRAGMEAQAASVTVLQDGAGLLPLSPGPRRVYAEGLAPEQVARLGEQVARPEDADLAVVRLQAPFEPRSDLFLEAWFHQGSLDLPPGLPVRLGRIADHCPLVIDVNLDRPAVLTPLLPVASVLTATYGSSDEAYVDALTGVVARAVACPSTCRGPWTTCGRTQRTGRGSRTRCSRPATAGAPADGRLGVLGHQVDDSRLVGGSPPSALWRRSVL